MVLDQTRKVRSRVSERLGIRLRRATFALRRLLMSRLSPLGFTHEQYMILLYLGEQEAMTQRQLARRSHTDPNTVTSILKRLEADGLVRRMPHESDGRAITVQITPEGEKVRRRLVGIADEVIELGLGSFLPADREVFLRCLDTVAEQAEKVANSRS